MTKEEKARRYDEALKKAKDVYTYYCDDREQLRKIESIFPELKESEDKRIRKALISILKSDFEKDTTIYDISVSDIIAWLEKQGEQEPIMDISKFKVGEWITNGQYNKLIVGINSDYHFYIFEDGTTKHIKDTDDHYHLWTIQDAKDGDVLCCESGWTCIFKKLVNDETFSSHCFMDHTKWFCETGSECHTLREEFVKAYNGKIYPATEEQRKLFFQKMEGAGYKWDTNNKQLIKLL